MPIICKKSVLIVFFTLFFLLSIHAAIITDDLSRKTDITLPVKKIISLSPSQTEIIYALGGEDKLIAVSVNCDYPAAALKKEKAGSFMSPDIEKIVKLKPDIVFANGEQHSKSIQAFEKLGIKAIAFCPQSVSDIEKNIRVSGKILGEAKNADRIIDDIEDKIRRLPPGKFLKTYVEIWGKPPLSIGGDSFVSDALLKAGGINIYGDSISLYPKSSPEEVIKRNPDIILLLYTPEAGYFKNGFLRLTKAWQTGNIVIVEKKDVDLMIRPGPRIATAIEIFHNILNGKVKRVGFSDSERVNSH